MRILVVDDDFGARRGLVQTLHDLYPDAELLQAESVAGAIAALQSQPDVQLVLLDLILGDSRGIDTLRALKQWCESADCNPRIVVVSAAADYDERLVGEAIDACATGFIAKGTSVEVFKSAIDLTLAGAIFIPERYVQHRARPPTPAATDAPPFTRREREVAGLLLKGLTYKQIARQLGLQDGRPMSDNTVRVHVQRMAWKLRLVDEADGALSAKAAVLTALAERRLRFPEGE